MAATVTVPCEGAVLPVTVRPSPPSLVSTELPFNTVFADVEPTSFVASGFTVRLTVVVVRWPTVSVAV